jgi:hypothetical protein
MNWIAQLEHQSLVSAFAYWHFASNEIMAKLAACNPCGNELAIRESLLALDGQ